MFGNFIYFIVVLLIFTTYYPPDKPYLGPFETLIVFLMLVAMFVASTRAAFRALTKKIYLNGPSGLHGRFDRIFHRQAIMAILIIAIDIYILNLQLYVTAIPAFSALPTLSALLFIGLFVVCLAIIWWMAYDAYTCLFQAKVSRKAYVLSNISFNLPVILPWLLISAVVDIINLLPFQPPKKLLATPEGQVIFLSCFLGALVVVAPCLIKVFWRCRPLPQGPQRKRIEELCTKAKLRYNNILNWPIFEGRILTAGVMGLVKRCRYILVTQALLRILNDEEIDSVMAHEIGHIKKKHLVLYLIFFLGLIVLSYAVFDLILYAILYANLTLPMAQDPKAESFRFISILYAGAMAVTLVVYFRYVFGYFMRNCERQADLYAFSLLGTGRGLVSSLEKIAVYSGQSHDRPNWHHFSIRQRIDFLNICEIDREWIARHDRKLRSSVAVFIAGLLCVGYVGYAINFGAIGKAINIHLLEKTLVKELQQNPADPALYSLLGSVYYQNKDYAKAISAYEKSIEFAPHNAEALNDLAWIYATCEQWQYRDPSKALVNAELAATLRPESHILDTLAESYYVNGLHEKAIIAIKQALATNPKDRHYYESQLRKFEEGLGD